MGRLLQVVIFCGFDIIFMKREDVVKKGTEEDGMRDWLKNLKLRKKIFLLIIVAVLCLTLAESINRQNAYMEYNHQAHEKNAEMVSLYIDYLETIFERMEQVTYGFIADEFLQEEFIRLQAGGANTRYEDSETLQSMMRTYVNREPYFSNFLIRTPYRDFVFGRIPADEVRIEEYIQTTEGKRGSLQMISEEGQLVLVREVRQVKDLEMTTLAYVMAWVDFQAVMNDIRSSFANANSDTKLAIYDGEICLYSDYEKLAEYRNAEDGWYIAGEDFITVYTSPARGYTMLIRTFYGDLQDMIRSVYIRSVVISLLVVSAALVICSFLIDIVLQDLERLIYVMDTFGEGKLPSHEAEQVYLNRSDEIGRLHRHFYQMIRDYQKVTEEYYNNKILLMESEYSRLQKQMQPHFLYNTLSFIRWQAYANRDYETADIVEALGRMMRRITDNSTVLISVESDLQMVEDYLKIQQKRFGDRLKTEIRISDETKRLSIPPISIQPLVENSVIHAMDVMISCCEIRIYDRVEENAVEIIVEDNGPGCEPDILEKLERGEVKTEGTGVALRNIHTRLQHAFSQEYGIRMRRLEEGMQVIIRIPGEQ